MTRRFFMLLLDRFAPRESLVLMALAVTIGAGTGLAAVFFIRLIAGIEHFLFTFPETTFPFFGRGWLIIVPVLGALISGFIIARFAMEAKGHGVPEVMQALILRGGRIRPIVAIAKILSAALCIGSGGSAGREGPIVQVGSAIGSSVGQWLGLSDERIKNMVACGAASGIAATFNAPIAGVVFATEVLMSELRVSVFGNVVISAVSASIVSQVFLGARPAFEVPSYIMRSPWEILLYAALGLLAALVGVMFIRMLNFFEDSFDNWKFPLALKPAVGALLLGLLAYSYPYFANVSPVSSTDMHLGTPIVNNLPHVYGSGFAFLDLVLVNKAPFLLLLLLVILKPLATSFTLGSGNSGGVFAPSLFTGAVLGGAFGHIAAAFFPNIAGEVGAYALVGMAAVFAAAARAPLTSMLIVFEMSNDYHLILPLMTAGIIASGFAQLLHPDSIYTIKLAKKGIQFDEGRDLDVMQGVLVEEVMTQAPVTMHKDQSAVDLFAAFQETHLQGFPVMENDEDILGIVTLQDLERTMQNFDVDGGGQRLLKDVKVGDVTTTNPLTVFPDEPIWEAIKKMSPRDLARLPVVSRHAPKKMVGLISRSDILRAYDVGLVRKQRAQHLTDRMALRRVAGLEFVDVTVGVSSQAEGKKVASLQLPNGTNLVSVDRQGFVLIPDGSTIMVAGDQITILCESDKVEMVQGIFQS